MSASIPDSAIQLMQKGWVIKEYRRYNSSVQMSKQIAGESIEVWVDNLGNVGIPSTTTIRLVLADLHDSPKMPGVRKLAPRREETYVLSEEDMTVSDAIDLIIDAAAGVIEWDDQDNPMDKSLYLAFVVALGVILGFESPSADEILRKRLS